MGVLGLGGASQNIKKTEHDFPLEFQSTSQTRTNYTFFTRLLNIPKPLVSFLILWSMKKFCFIYYVHLCSLLT